MTEILLFSVKKSSHVNVKIDHVVLGKEKILFSEKAKNLGVLFDNELSCDAQVSSLCKQVYFETCRIGKMAPFLDENSLKCLVSAFIFSKLDYCNSMLANLSLERIKRLQRFQNIVAKMVLKKKKQDHVTPLLIHLHWLPVQARIEYKLSVLCHKCLHNKAPVYLSSMITAYKPSRTLRSGDKNLLVVPKMKTRKFGERAFSHYAPYIWNSLPFSIREISKESAFKSELKTHLFRRHLM